MIEINTLETDMKLNEINYALKDIKESLVIWRDDKELDDPYILKLYREFDKLIVMKQKMMGVTKTIRTIRSSLPNTNAKEYHVITNAQRSISLSQWQLVSSPWLLG